MTRQRRPTTTIRSEVKRSVISVRDFYKKKKKRAVKHSFYYDKIGMCLRLVRDQMARRTKGRLGGKQPRHDNDGSYSFDEYEDRLGILVHNDTQMLEKLRNIHNVIGPDIQSTMQLLFVLVHVRQAVQGKYADDTHDNIETVALYLAKGLSFRPRPFLDETRSLCLSFLVDNNNNGNHAEESSVNLPATVNFLAGLDAEVPHGLDAECPVWWELRAHVSNEKRRICHRATTVACAIAEGATHLEFGLHTGANLLCTGVQKTGQWVQSQTRRAPPQAVVKQRDEVVRLVYTDAARRAATVARETTRDCMDALLNVSGQGVARVTTRIGRDAVLPPWAQAAGQVSMAGLGAFVVVGETVVQATCQVVIVVADTAADLVQHRYGRFAGQSVRDCTATVGSLWMTARSGSTLASPLAWSRVVARHNCKELLREQQYLKSGGGGTTNVGKTAEAETEAIFDQALKRFL